MFLAQSCGVQLVASSWSALRQSRSSSQHPQCASLIPSASNCLSDNLKGPGAATEPSPPLRDHERSPCSNPRRKTWHQQRKSWPVHHTSVVRPS